MNTESQTDELAVNPDENQDDSWSARDVLMAIGAFIVVAAIAVGAFFFYQSRQAPPLKEGMAAPDFTLNQLGGGQVSLSDFKGKVVLLNIWATWCNPCRTEMPSMQSLTKLEKDKPFVILAATIDNNEPAVQDFVKELGLTFPILLDDDKEVSGLYQTTGVPESLIIDKNGIIQKRIIGPAEWNDPNTNEFQLIQHLIVSP